jgi:hypothetical protein
MVWISSLLLLFALSHPLALVEEGERLPLGNLSRPRTLSRFSLSQNPPFSSRMAHKNSKIFRLLPRSSVSLTSLCVYVLPRQPSISIRRGSTTTEKYFQARHEHENFLLRLFLCCSFFASLLLLAHPSRAFSMLRTFSPHRDDKHTDK